MVNGHRLGEKTSNNESWTGVFFKLVLKRSDLGTSDSTLQSDGRQTRNATLNPQICNLLSAKISQENSYLQGVATTLVPPLGISQPNHKRSPAMRKDTKLIRRFRIVLAVQKEAETPMLTDNLEAERKGKTDGFNQRR